MTAEPPGTTARDIVRTIWVLQHHGETMQAQVLDAKGGLELRIGKRGSDLPAVWLFGSGHAQLEAQAAFIRRALIAAGWTPV